MTKMTRDQAIADAAIAWRSADQLGSILQSILMGEKPDLVEKHKDDASSSVEANGWDCGVMVQATANTGDEDQFAVYLTGGSNGRATPKLLGIFTRADLDRMNLHAVQS